MKNFHFPSTTNLHRPPDAIQFNRSSNDLFAPELLALSLGTQLDLDDEETHAPLNLLMGMIEADPYPLSP
jgi:hypothetical protein